MRELKGKIDKSTIIVKDFNTHHIVIDRIKRQKISKDTKDLINSLSQVDLTDKYKILYYSLKPHNMH